MSGLVGRLRLGRSGINRHHAEVLTVEGGLLDADNGVGGDDRFIAPVLLLFMPSEAKPGARRAEGAHAGLDAKEQRTGSSHVCTGTVIGEPDNVLVPMEDGAVVLTESALDHLRVTTHGGHQGFMDVGPPCGPDGLPHVIRLVGVDDADV